MTVGRACDNMMRLSPVARLQDEGYYESSVNDVSFQAGVTVFVSAEIVSRLMIRLRDSYLSLTRS